MTGRRARLFGRDPAAAQAAAGQAAPGQAAATQAAAGQAAATQAGQQAADATSVPFTEAERAAVPASVPVAALTIDALGRKCPIPIIMLAEQIRDVPLGAVVAVLADDPAAYTDIPSWCVMKAHEFAGHQELPAGGWALYIRRCL